MTKQSALMTALSILFIFGCADERPIEKVIDNPYRLSKTTFENGPYLYAKTYTSVRTPGKLGSSLAPGFYIHSDVIVQFEIKEDSLDVVSIDPHFNLANSAHTNAILASFPISHVDVLRKQNDDGVDTHEEELTKTRRVWTERQFIELDAKGDKLDELEDNTKIASNVGDLSIESDGKVINFTVTRQLEDDTTVDVRYSFLKFEPSTTYQPMDYSNELQRQFGFFTSVTHKYDIHGRLTTKTRSVRANRWDTSKTIIYYLSKNFPDHLKPVAQQVFANWNESFKKAVGHDVLELRENTGQELGDLRYSMLYYDDTPYATHGILGYGPSYTNPRTGEIVKADTILYGSALKRSVYREQLWTALLNETPGRSEASGPNSGGSSGGQPKHTPAGATEQLESILMGQLDTGLSSQLSPQSILAVTRNAGNYNEEFHQAVKDYNFRNELGEIRSQMYDDHRKAIFRITPDVLTSIAAIATSEESQKLSQEERDRLMEIRIFTPLLTHETGHNFGLRHNFMASADERHFIEGTQTSSVMDYGFLSAHEPLTVGPYDDAAVQILYGADEGAKKRIIADNYYFCTDQDVMDSKNSVCNPFDAGTNLTDVIQNHENRYKAGYIFNNLKLDRMNIGSTSNYINRIQRYLIPIRLAFDNANAITRAIKLFQRKRSIGPLWLVARQRIEADLDSKPENIGKVKILDYDGLKLDENGHPMIDKSSGQYVREAVEVIRYIDAAKIEDLKNDAVAAQTQAFTALVRILFDRDRPVYDSTDLLESDVSIRGTLYDKMLAVLYIGSRTRDPLEDGQTLTMFSALDSGAASVLFGALMSKTLPRKDPISGTETNQLISVDQNVREMALNVLVSELAIPGSGAEAREMMALAEADIDTELVRSKLMVQMRVQPFEQLKKVVEAHDGKLTVTDLFKAAGQAGISLPDLLPILPIGAESGTPFTEDQIKIVLKGLDTILDDLDKQSRVLVAQMNKDERTWNSIESLRAQIRYLYIQMEAATDEAEQKKIYTNIKMLEAERNKINFAFLKITGDLHLQAENKLMGFSFSTASGHLIRDNINVMQDRRMALEMLNRVEKSMLEGELKKEKKDQDMEIILELYKKVTERDELIENIHNYLASEKLFAKKMFQFYRDYRG